VFSAFSGVFGVGIIPFLGVFLVYDRFLAGFVRCCVVFGFVGKWVFGGYFACFEWGLVLFSVFLGFRRRLGLV